MSLRCKHCGKKASVTYNDMCLKCIWYYLFIVCKKKPEGDPHGKNP